MGSLGFYFCFGKGKGEGKLGARVGWICLYLFKLLCTKTLESSKTCPLRESVCDHYSALACGLLLESRISVLFLKLSPADSHWNLQYFWLKEMVKCHLIAAESSGQTVPWMLGHKDPSRIRRAYCSTSTQAWSHPAVPLCYLHHNTRIRKFLAKSRSLLPSTPFFSSMWHLATLLQHLGHLRKGMERRTKSLLSTNSLESLLNVDRASPSGASYQLIRSSKKQTSKMN